MGIEGQGRVTGCMHGALTRHERTMYEHEGPHLSMLYCPCSCTSVYDVLVLLFLPHEYCINP